jgi:transposase
MGFSRQLEVDENLATRLYHWYTVECRSQREIGSMLGVSVTVIRRLFNECSIRTRTKSEANSDRFRNKPKKNARITRSCLICGKSFRASIRSDRKRCSRSCSTSERNRLQGIKTIAAVEKRFNEPITNLLRSWHWEENRTNKQISALVGASEHIVFRWFRRFKIPHRNKSEAMRLLVGPKHSVWKGGIRHPYGNDFIETSLQTKIRDKWAC